MSALAGVKRSVARASVATPLALLVFVASLAIAKVVAKPSLSQISRDYITILTPSESFIRLYWLVLGTLLLGSCFYIVLARSEDSLLLIANGVGLRLSLVIGLMAVWTLFWTLRLFLVAEIVLLVNLIFAVSIWGTLLLYRPATTARVSAVDYLFLHVPARMLVCVLFSVDIWHQGLLALSWYRYLGDEPNHRTGRWEGDHTAHSWIAFGVILGVALVNAGITFAFTDVAWGLSCIYLSIALAYNSEGKPPQVYVTLILGAALVFVALASSIGWKLLQEDEEGAIRLAEDEEEEAEAAAAAARASAVANGPSTSAGPVDPSTSV